VSGLGMATDLLGLACPAFGLATLSKSFAFRRSKGFSRCACQLSESPDLKSPKTPPPPSAKSLHHPASSWRLPFVAKRYNLPGSMISGGVNPWARMAPLNCSMASMPHLRSIRAG
jgi:hypothetical protein